MNALRKCASYKHFSVLPILGLLMAAIVLGLAPMTLAQETPPLPYLVVGGFTTVLAEPHLGSDALGRPDTLELAITGISEDGTFYRVAFKGGQGWIHQSDVLKIEGDLDVVPVIDPASQARRPAGRSSLNTLHHYDEGWSSAVAELQSAGVVPRGGSLIFEEDYAFVSGRGDFFIALGRQHPETDVIMAGELRYDVGTETEYEYCGFSSRIATNNRGNATQYLEVSLDNEHDVTFHDQFGPGDVQAHFDYAEAHVNLEVPHHFLILALDNQLTVYLDGKLIVSGFAITERAGIYGLGLHGRGIDARCEGRDIWVYQVPYAQAGVCEIRVDRLANMRLGPGTNFDQAGQLTPGSTRRAQAVTLGHDGFIWWQLVNGRWVRNDVVDAFGDCQNLPGPADRAQI